MNTTTLQMQTVLFHNDVSHLMRSLEYLANALEVARRQGWDIALRVVYGDASSQPLFTPEASRRNAGEVPGRLHLHLRVFP